MLLVGPLEMNDRSGNMGILGLSHYPTLSYENAVILIVGHRFQKATSKIARKINPEFYYKRSNNVEYSQLLLSLYLLIRDLQSNNSKLKPIENIEQILEKKVIKKKPENKDISVNPYPESLPYYKISPDVGLIYYDTGAHNPMRILTGYQYTFITHRDENKSFKISVNKHKSKGHLQTSFTLRAIHHEIPNRELIDFLIENLSTLYYKQITKINFLCIIEKYLYEDYYQNKYYGFNIDFISFAELYKKEILYHYGILSTDPIKYVAWSETNINLKLLLSVMYKLILDLVDKHDELWYEKESNLYKSFIRDKNNLYNIIAQSLDIKYIQHVTVFYIYDTSYCCENFQIVKRFENNQDLVIYMKVEIRAIWVHHYVVVSVPKYQKMFHNTLGRSKLIKNFLLSAISDSSTNIRYKLYGFDAYLIIS